MEVGQWLPLEREISRDWEVIRRGPLVGVGNALYLIWVLVVLLVQSLCAQSIKRLKFKTSESRVRKGLSIEKVPTRKMGGLVAPQIHLLKVQSSGFFYGKEKWEEPFLENSSSSRFPLMTDMSICKTRQELLA